MVVLFLTLSPVWLRNWLVFGIFNDAFSFTGCTLIRLLNWKWYWTKRPWPSWIYYSRSSYKNVSKTTKNFSEDMWSLWLESNSEPPIYGAGLLISDCYVQFWYTVFTNTVIGDEYTLWKFYWCIFHSLQLLLSHIFYFYNFSLFVLQIPMLYLLHALFCCVIRETSHLPLSRILFSWMQADVCSPVCRERMLYKATI
jgi:hypothetical protein